MAPVASASAPDLGAASKVRDRARLQGLLTKATNGKLPPPRSMGGAPRSSPPRRRSSSGMGGIGSAATSVRMGPGPGDSPGGRSASLGAKLGVSAARSTGALPPHVQLAGNYVSKLMGKGLDTAADGPLDWRLVSELDAVDGLLQEDQARRQMSAQRHILKNQLNAQKAEFRIKNTHDDRDDRRWGQKMQQDAASFFQEQMSKRDSDREAALRFDQERAQLLEVTQRARQMEIDKDRELERMMAERSINARRIEIQKAEDQKKRIQASAMIVQKAREDDAARKKQVKQAEASLDVTCMELQQAALDKQERLRNEKFEKIRDAQEKKMKTFEANTGAAMVQIQKDSEERAQRQHEERTKKEFQEHQLKQDKMLQVASDRKSAVRNQLEEKSEKRAKDREESMKLAEEFRREAQVHTDMERKKAAEKKEKARENAAFLLTQMNERSRIVPGRFGHEQMSGVEKSMNKDRLERANNSESLQLLFQNKKIEYMNHGSTILGK